MNNIRKIDVISIVDSFIEKNGYNKDDYSHSEDLISTGILDSLDVANIILEIEKSLGCEVDSNGSAETINKEWFLSLI